MPEEIRSIQGRNAIDIKAARAASIATKGRLSWSEATKVMAGWPALLALMLAVSDFAALAMIDWICHLNVIPLTS